MTVSNPHQLGGNNRDWLLTLLTVVLTLMIFAFAPLQAADIFVFQTFAIAGLLPIIAGALIISGNPIADSEAKRPVIPTEGGHPIRSKAATDSDRRRPPC